MKYFLQMKNEYEVKNKGQKQAFNSYLLTIDDINKNNNLPNIWDSKDILK
jgi:hypothetical protein